MQVEVEEKELEEQMGRLLSGEGLEVTMLDVIPELARPPVVLKKTVSYIVCAVIFNDKEEVLMVQEAKQECYKQWYLPAGRMEEGESIVQALRREVKEEAGFDCQPITLLLIQEQGPQWIRFIFLVKVTGGSLKTPQEADQESLQAAWWDRTSPLSLRGRDILQLIDVGLKYRQLAWHPTTMPIDMPCQHVAQRIIMTFTNSQQELWVLLVTAPSAHLPAAAAVKTHTVTWTACMVLQEATPSRYHDYDLCTLGVLGVQHNGRQLGKMDGVCLNTLVSLVEDRPQRNEDGERLEPADSSPPPLENPRYRWHRVRNDALRQNILERIKKKSILPVNSLY